MIYRRQGYDSYSSDSRYGRDPAYDDIYEGEYNRSAPRGYGNQTGFRYSHADRFNPSRRAYNNSYDMGDADYDYGTRYSDNYNSPRFRRNDSRAYTGSDYGRGSYYGDSSVYDEDDYDSNYGYTRGYRNRTFDNRYAADDSYGRNRQQRPYASNYGNSRYDPYGAYNTSDYSNEDYDRDMRYGRSGLERSYDSRYGAPRYGRGTTGNYGNASRYDRGYPANDWEEREPRRRSMAHY